ncbi:hypothetical protein CLAFUW4_12421 [Fulvia fulva]|uniref:BTB domain-containing protein n=1 Tax=Passalora fulva TaxID=5499 RepID=A0A9Q8PET9_PASFU|nr:uncharacterized protein CLAFUR5_11449 [Fulvia fulva]KAK4617759.1 hypothetical protein CLAFUR4_12426 [Fulvia fulva]KAK4618594.1 hypothetical protein CLAFUR0_12437 [Fulvia fulva]UJO21125.1 hypothetical protein CLAFUR5_11449 [Fulvia fulva]WPV18550.1 hypothetical protein CLAFUW4_12421 [Fulvia fulva]WPV32844.1 hypothetical protein CLAFUW7_12428 [Fulvia fulva]
MPRFDKLAADSAFLDSISASFNKPSAFPDITITCGAQKFLCHKLILTHRSKWFQKALNGGFEESKADTIELHDEDEDVIHAMLDFCYRTAYWYPKVAVGDFTVPNANFHALVFAAGEKYFVKGLADLAADKFEAAAKGATEDQLATAITTVYTAVPDPDKNLRKAVVDIVLERSSTPLSGENLAFDKLFETLPSFGGDIARGLAKKSLPATPASKPRNRYKCPANNCNKHFTADIPEGTIYTYSCPSTHRTLFGNVVRPTFTHSHAEWRPFKLSD